MSRCCIKLQWFSPHSQWHLRWHLSWVNNATSMMNQRLTSLKKKLIEHWENIMKNYSLPLTLSLCPRSLSAYSLSLSLKKCENLMESICFCLGHTWNTICAKSCPRELHTADQRCFGIINQKWKENNSNSSDHSESSAHFRKGLGIKDLLFVVYSSAVLPFSPAFFRAVQIETVIHSSFQKFSFSPPHFPHTFMASASFSSAIL